MEDERLKQRFLELLEEEQNNSEELYYLSFSQGKVKDNNWLGAALVYARGAADAITICHQLKINPGGGVACVRFPDSENVKMPPEAMNRLLTREEVEKYFGKTSIHKYKEL